MKSLKLSQPKNSPFDRAPHTIEEDSYFKGQGGQAKKEYNGKCFQQEKGPSCNNQTEFPQLDNLNHVHQSVKQIFAKPKVHSVPLAGRLKYFQPAWKMRTQNKSSVEGLRFPLVSEPIQESFYNFLEVKIITNKYEISCIS